MTTVTVTKRDLVTVTPVCGRAAARLTWLFAELPTTYTFCTYVSVSTDRGANAPYTGFNCTLSCTWRGATEPTDRSKSLATCDRDRSQGRSRFQTAPFRVSAQISASLKNLETFSTVTVPVTVRAIARKAGAVRQTDVERVQRELQNYVPDPDRIGRDLATYPQPPDKPGPEPMLTAACFDEQCWRCTGGPCEHQCHSDQLEIDRERLESLGGDQ